MFPAVLWFDGTWFDGVFPFEALSWPRTLQKGAVQYSYFGRTSRPRKVAGGATSYAGPVGAVA